MEASINNLLIHFNCQKCMKTYETPVILPCGHSICQKHVIESKRQFMSTTSTMTSGTAAKVICDECTKIFEIPPEGFTCNVAVEKMLESQYPSISMLPELKAALQSFKVLAEVYNESRVFMSEPEVEVNRALSVLRNQVDLRREEIKMSADKEALDIIKELDEYEMKSKRRLQHTHSNATSTAANNESDKENENCRLNETFRLTESNLKQWEEEFKKFGGGDSRRWRAIHNEAVKNCLELSKKIRPIKRKLFTDNFALIENKAKKFCRIERVDSLV